ncbi:MAG: cytochrome c biogenesis protein CcsA [Bacteroidaceae bacterium]|nr:cytochrome c biogenesis protein CcsA [Bacteroidaceae bacterium]
MEQKRNKILLTIRRTSFTIYAILAMIMAAATFIENSYGSSFVHKHIYDAWWFIALWIAALCLSITCIHKHFAWIKRLFCKKGKTAAIALLCLLPLCSNAAERKVVEREQADSMRTLQVIYNDRICPLNTPALELTKKLTGKKSFEGLTAEQILLSWSLYPEEWKDVKMIKVKKSATRNALGIKDEYASFADFFDEEGNYRLTPGKYTEIEDRLILLVLLTQGELFTPLPKEYQPLSKARIETEILYNNIPTNIILFSSSFTLAFCLFFLQLKHKDNKAIRVTALSIKILLSLFLATSLGVRWYISEHIPLTNTYETMQIVALTALLYSCFTHKNAMPPLIIAGATLLVTHIASFDPQITVLMPALQSPWLSSHVTTIMISYSLFAMLLFKPNKKMLIWAEVLLATGILLGSIWAKTAWGSYWSWDPKETWALISLIVYMYPLHPATFPWFRSESHQKLYLRLAFLTILMTYFGCNYLLTGMHSYAQ